MSKKTLLAAGVSPFANLMAGFRAKRAEDEDDKTKGKRAEDETPPDEEGPTDPDKVVDDTKVDDVEDPDDQDPEADADDDDDDADEKMATKEAKAYRQGLAAGRARENARSTRIFQSAGANGRPDLAATLAFTTRNTSAEAGRLMSIAAIGGAPQRRLDDRMGSRIEARPGAGTGTQGNASFGERVAAAVKKAGR